MENNVVVNYLKKVLPLNTPKIETKHWIPEDNKSFEIIKDINYTIPKILNLDNKDDCFTQYIHNILIVVVLVFTTIAFDSKSHDKIYDRNGMLKNDASMESFIFGMLITLIVLFSIPLLFFKTFTLGQNIYINNTIVFCAIITTFIFFFITNIDVLFPDKSTYLLNPNTPQGAVFIAFIILLGLFILNIILLKFDNNWLSFIPYLTNIGFIISLVVWSCGKVFDYLKPYFYFLTGNTDLLLNQIREPVKKPEEGPSEIGKVLQSLKNDGELMKYGMVFFVIIFLFTTISIAAFDKYALTQKTYVYAITIIVALMVIFSFMITLNTTMALPAIALAIIFFIVVLYNYYSLNKEYFAGISYLINIVFGCIVLTGLSIFFFMFSNYLKSIGGWLGVIIYFIFYIPCLIIDFVNYIKKEISLTTNTVLLLLLIEIILIILYYTMPKISNIVQADGIGLLNDSMFLDSYQVIGNSEQFKAPQIKDIDNQGNVYNQNYSMSMWIYLNTQTYNNLAYSKKETVIFDYGNGKPQIAYNTNELDTYGKDKYIVYFTNVIDSKNPELSSYEFTLPSQKWNNFVFNYTSTKVDLYLNGSLEYTYNFTNNLPVYTVNDVVSVGANNGLNGAICNVRYFSKPLTSQKIATMYNLLMYSNPPTIIL